MSSSSKGKPSKKRTRDTETANLLEGIQTINILGQNSTPHQEANAGAVIAALNAPPAPSISLPASPTPHAPPRVPLTSPSLAPEPLASFPPEAY